MKKILLAFLLLSAVIVSAQTVLTTGAISSAGAACAVGSGATNCVFLPLSPQTSAVTISISGTFVATLVFEESPDGGTTWVTAQGPVSSTPVAGTWVFSAASMTYLRVRASAYTSGNAIATLNPSLVAPIVGAADPCLSPAVTKLSAFVDVTTATTTSLTSISGSTVTYVCGFVVTMSGTTAADTIQFIAGTGATCATATVNLSPIFNSGVMANGSTVIAYGGHGSVFKPTLQSTHVCVVTTVGTAPAIDVLISYVQQ